ncbi:bromodomain and extraterminal domain protein [Trifolium repens]|nr:bromodomain and extraterminal domain protein [Trifolium repens]
MASSDQQPRKRLIIKLSYGSKKDDGSCSMDDDSQGNKKRRLEKPIVSCYWLDANQPLQKKDNKNIENQLSVSATTDGAAKDHSMKNDGNGGTELMVKKEEKKKKPMEHYKRMQCWVIVKRMIEGRDGWALKAPLDIKFLKGGLENKSKVKKKAIGLKDIEGKLKSYSSPDEFADDMRFVFDHGLCYPRGNDVYRIAARLSDTFEHKWKVLKKEWALEEKRLKYKNHKFMAKKIEVTG